MEALQLSWLYIMVSGCLNYGRMDDYMGDFLAADLKAGRITEEKALAYLQSLWRILAARKTVFHGRVVIGGRGRHNEANADRFALLALSLIHICNVAYVTTMSKQPELVVKYFDWLVSDQENYKLGKYGIENTHYVIEEDGRWRSPDSAGGDDSKRGYEDIFAPLEFEGLMRCV